MRAVLVCGLEKQMEEGGLREVLICGLEKEIEKGDCQLWSID